MKYLVLALCVCAASAASLNAYRPWQGQKQVSKAVAQVSYKPVGTTKYGAPTPVVAAKAVVVPASKNVYNAKDEEATVLRAASDVNGEGFNYYYETSNGIAAQSSGVLRRVADEDVLAVQGAYQYIAPDGTPVQFSYIADENGYQPKSDLLPVAPPVPEAILRSLEYIRTHPQKSDNYNDKYVQIG